MSKVLIAVTAVIFLSTPAMSFEYAYTYDNIQQLKRSRPEVAHAYLKGIAEAAFTFRVVESGVYTFCPPRGTRVDIELVELAATNEVRLQSASPDDWYHSLVKQGLQRAFPCEK